MPKSKKQSGEDLDALLAELGPKQGTSAAQRAFFFAVALAVSALPVYLYSTPMFGMGLEDYAVVYAAVVLASAAALSTAYDRVATKNRVRLLRERQDAATAPGERLTKQQKADRQESLERSTATECTAHALFLCNAVYLGSVLACGFYLVPKLSASIGVVPNFVLSVAGPAAVLALRG